MSRESQGGGVTRRVCPGWWGRCSATEVGCRRQGGASVRETAESVFIYALRVVYPRGIGKIFCRVRPVVEVGQTCVHIRTVARVSTENRSRNSPQSRLAPSPPVANTRIVSYPRAATVAAQRLGLGACWGEAQRRGRPWRGGGASGGRTRRGLRAEGTAAARRVGVGVARGGGSSFRLKPERVGFTEVSPSARPSQRCPSPSRASERYADLHSARRARQ